MKRVCAPAVEPLEQRRLLSFSVSSATLLGPQSTPGTKWTYEDSSGGSGFSSVTTVVGPDTFQGHSVTRLDTVTTYGAGTPNVIVSDESYYDAFTDGEYISYGYTAHSPGGPSDLFTDSPFSIKLPPTLEIGQSYTSSYTETGVYQFSSSPTVTQITDDTITFSLNSAVLQPITVPAGTFGCYEVDVRATGVLRDPVFTSMSSARSYYAPGIGLVKQESSINDPLHGSSTVLASFEPAPHKLTFAQGPSDGAADQTLSPVVVQILDGDGNLESAASDSANKVTLSISGDGILQGTTSVNAVGGIATFSDLSISNGGVYKLTASSDAPITSATSSTFTITGEAGSLTPQLVKANVPASAVGGGKVNITANVAVTNNTDASIVGLAKMSAFLVGPSGLNSAVASLRSSFTGSPEDAISLQIGKTVTQRVNLKPHAASHITAHLTSLPNVAVAGTYSLQFIVTDPKGNTATVVGPSISVGPAVITLGETIAALKIPSTITIGPKLKAASIKLIVKNSGNVIARGKTTFAITASTVSGVAGTSIQSTPVVLNLAPGKSKPVTINMKSLPTLAAGSYFIVVQATDSLGGESQVSSPSPITLPA